MTSAERQKRYREKAKQKSIVLVTARMPHEKAIKLTYLANHWNCTKQEALERIIMEAWEREGSVIRLVPKASVTE